MTPDHPTPPSGTPPVPVSSPDLDPTSLVLEEGRPVLVDAKQVNFAQEPGLYGLYASRHAALQHLRTLADTHRLCYGVLGLEKLSPGRACFRAQLHQCAGACCGRETLTDHQERFLTALLDVQVITWPYASHGADTVALVERDETQIKGQQADDHQASASQKCHPLEDFHVVRNWCYLGTVHSLDEAKALNQVEASFDADSYKILCRPLMTQAVQVVPL